MKNEKKLEEALWAVLQWGYMWGHPRYISSENWEIIRESYKDLNDGKDFEPDTTQAAK